VKLNGSTEQSGFRSPRETYTADGYVVIKGLLPRVVLSELCEEILLCFRCFLNDRTLNLSQIIQSLNNLEKTELHNAHKVADRLVGLSKLDSIFAESCKELSNNDFPVISIAKGLLLGIPADERLVYDFHQESNYMFDFREIFNVHYPMLGSATILNGTMSVLKGSHCLGNLGFLESKSSSNSYTDKVPFEIEEIKSNFAEVHCELERGDVLFFDQHLVHKSNRNLSSECRLVGVSRLTQDVKGKFGV
jgi:hypothetical protein